MGSKARKTLIIKESEWGKGYLLEGETGKKCCLGFWCEQFGGVESKFLTDVSLPRDLSGVAFPDASTVGLRFGAADRKSDDRDLQQVLADANDSLPNDRERKKAIRQGFRRIGINVRFVP